MGWMHGGFQLDELVEQLEAPVLLLAKGGPHGRTGYTFHHLGNLRQNSGLYTWKNLLASLDGVWNTFDDLRGLLNALLRYLSNI